MHADDDVIRAAGSVALESEAVRIQVNSGLGGKILSLFDIEKGCEWLIQKPAGSAPAPAEGEDFHRCCMFGWEEMFPTLLACLYPGPGKYLRKPLHDHGELWFTDCELAHTSHSIIQRYACRTYNMIFNRVIRFIGSRTVELSYQVENRESERLYYFWAPHPFFRVQAGDAVVFPNTVRKAINALADEEFGAAGNEIDWRGKEIQGPAFKRRRKLFWTPGQGGSFAAIASEKNGRFLRLSWNEKENPFFSCIIDEGHSHDEARVSFEPMNGMFDTLEAAYRNGSAKYVDPGERQAWKLTLEIGS